MIKRQAVRTSKFWTKVLIAKSKHVELCNINHNDPACNVLARCENFGLTGLPENFFKLSHANQKQIIDLNGQKRSTELGSTGIQMLVY